MLQIKNVHEMQIYCKVTPAGTMLASSSTSSHRPLIVDSDHILQIKMISIIIIEKADVARDLGRYMYFSNKFRKIKADKEP